MKPLGVIINPAANRGRGNQVGDKALAAFAEAGIATTNLSGTSQDDIRAKVKASAKEISGLVAIGGDGTSQLGVNLAMEYSLPLGLVPAGSGNDQVRELALSLTDTSAAVANIFGTLECPREVDVMWVETDYRKFWSLGSISAGFDALCAERANRLVWPKGPNSYVAALFLELPKFKPIAYRVEADGVSREFKAMLCGVANVKNFGGGMKISPQSEITDGEVEVFILHEVSRRKLLEIFPKVYKGEHVNYAEVEIFKASKVRIENDGFPMTCDGEIIGPAPFSVEIRPKGLALLSR
ncbi:MAG: diacylglycerol/lipid kinase family protein [Aquiluna sp.]